MAYSKKQHLTENMLDIYKFNLLQTKQTFISQMKNNTLNVRTIDEGAGNESGVMNYAEYIALLSGNSDFLEKVKLEREILRLEGEKKAFNKSIAKAQWKLGAETSEIEKQKSRLALLENEDAYIKTEFSQNQADWVDYIIIDGFDLITAEDKNQKLLELSKQMNTNQEIIKTGSVKDFDIFIQSEKLKDGELFFTTNHMFLSRNNGLRFRFEKQFVSPNNISYVNPMMDVLKKIPREISNLKDEIENTDKNIGVYKKMTLESWSKSQKLYDAKLKLSSIERKMKSEMSSV